MPSSSGTSSRNRLTSAVTRQARSAGSGRSYAARQAALSCGREGRMVAGGWRLEAGCNKHGRVERLRRVQCLSQSCAFALPRNSSRIRGLRSTCSPLPTASSLASYESARISIETVVRPLWHSGSGRACRRHAGRGGRSGPADRRFEMGRQGAGPCRRSRQGGRREAGRFAGGCGEGSRGDVRQAPVDAPDRPRRPADSIRCSSRKARRLPASCI